MENLPLHQISQMTMSGLKQIGFLDWSDGHPNPDLVGEN